MTSALSQFMLESPLFDIDSVQQSYAQLTNAHLAQHLADYRVFRLGSAGAPSQPPISHLSILPERYEKPQLNVLRQSLLYVDRVVIDDPVFRHTKPIPADEIWLSRLAGRETPTLDRAALAHDAAYLWSLKEAIDVGVVDVLPLSHHSENTTSVSKPSPLDTPIASELRTLFHQSADVRSLRPTLHGWEPTDTLQLSNRIEIRFHDDYPDRLYDPIPFVEQKTSLYVGDNPPLLVGQQRTIPQGPLHPNLFTSWIHRSIDEAADKFVTEITQDLTLAAATGTSLFTGSTFADRVLRHLRGPSSLRQDTHDNLIDMELPITANVSLEDIVRIRQDDGEAFQSFRVYLDSQLRELRLITDPEQLRSKRENAAQEMEAHLHTLAVKMKAVTAQSWLKEAGAGVALLTACVAHIIPYIAIPAFAVTIGSIVHDADMQKRENPVYFLWRVNQQADRSGRRH